MAEPTAKNSVSPDHESECEEVFVFDAIDLDPEKCGFSKPQTAAKRPRLLIVRRDSDRWKKLLYGQ